MMSSGIKPDRSVFWCVIDALVEQGHLNKAQNHLENMFKTLCSGKRPSYVPLLLELSEEGDVGLAKDLFFHMYRDESLEMYKDVVNYDALFDILYTSGNEEEAKKLVESMAENPDYFLNDVKLINVTFDNLCKKGSLDAAVSVLKIMLVELYEIRDMVGCSALINALCFEGRFCEALDVLALVEKRGYQLDAGTYNTLMDEYCNEEMFEDAFDLLLEMEGKGFSPNVATLNTLVSGFARQKEGARVEEILQKMHAMKISPNLDTKSILSSMELAL